MRSWLSDIFQEKRNQDKARDGLPANIKPDRSNCHCDTDARCRSWQSRLGLSQKTARARLPHSHRSLVRNDMIGILSLDNADGVIDQSRNDSLSTAARANVKNDTRSSTEFYNGGSKRRKPRLQILSVIGLLMLLAIPWLVRAQVNAPDTIHKIYLPLLFDPNPATTISTPLPPGKIENPGFEQGLTGWWFHWNTANPIIASDQPHTGSYSARLGDGEIGRKASIIQTLVVPTDKTKLNFWLYYVSDDECGFNPDDLIGDYLSVYVENIRMHWTAICNPNSPNPPPAPAWELISIDLSAYQGAQVFLEVEFTSDVTIGSFAYVDDFAFVLP